MSILQRILGRTSGAGQTVEETPTVAAPSSENEEYWTEHNVTLHAQFPTPDASLAYFDWRNAQYHPYIDLMPVTGQDGMSVLDYGCGPGNDLVGFGHYSRPKRLIGADISTSSLREARARLNVHSIKADLIHIAQEKLPLPFPDQSIDYVHSSGVVHHTQDPVHVLKEFRRVLSAKGSCRIMVYNYNSLWVHLYVAYMKMIREGLYSDMDIRTAFAKTTDGENCPISRAYRPEEFCSLAERAGFRCRFAGAAISMWEARIFPDRFEAIMNQKLPAEHRNFLQALTIDEKGLPKYQGHYAGIDGCYLLTPS